MRRRALLASTASATIATAAAGCVGTLQRPVDVQTHAAGNDTVYDPGTVLFLDTVELGRAHDTLVVGDRDGVRHPDQNRRHTVMFVTADASRRLAFAIHADGYEVYEQTAEYGPDDWQVIGFLQPANYVIRLRTSADAYAVEIPRDAFRCEPSKRSVRPETHGVDVSTDRPPCYDG